MPADLRDIVQKVAVGALDPYLWSDADLNALKAFARARGTYYQGSVTFGALNKIPSGLVFVDTASGRNVTPEGLSPATPPSDLAAVDVRDGAAAEPTGVFRGWLVVNGTLTISGSLQMDGLIYAQDDLVYGRGASGLVTGTVISRNIRSGPSTSIDANPGTTSTVAYDCARARTGGGAVPDRWGLKVGSYKEVSGS